MNTYKVIRNDKNLPVKLIINGFTIHLFSDSYNFDTGLKHVEVTLFSWLLNNFKGLKDIQDKDIIDMFLIKDKEVLDSKEYVNFFKLHDKSK